MKIRTIKNPFPKFQDATPKTGEELRVLAEEVAESLKEQADYLKKEREDAISYNSLYT
jgi:hypothetical protein